MTDAPTTTAASTRQRNLLIGHLQALRTSGARWDSTEGQRSIDEVLAVVDQLVAIELDLARLSMANTSMPSPWIDITKELPPIRSVVLVKWRDGGITAAEVWAPSAGELVDFDTYGVGGQEREWLWSDYRDPYEGVTHWMPMPKGPK